MSLRGRVWHVALFVCLGLIPSQAQAAMIGFNDTLASSNQIFFQPFTISGPTSLTGEVTAGFFPVLTLFGTDDSATPEFLFGGDGLGYRWLTEFQTFTNTITIDPPFELTLATGSRYLLALSQQPFLFSPATGMFESADPELTALIESCGGFLDANFECGDGTFAGSLTIAETTIPEPGTLSLLAVGGAAAATRRRKRDES